MLTAGSRIGPYEIQSALGAGDMGGPGVYFQAELSHAVVQEVLGIRPLSQPSPRR